MLKTQDELTIGHLGRKYACILGVRTGARTQCDAEAENKERRSYLSKDVQRKKAAHSAPERWTGFLLAQEGNAKEKNRSTS